MTKDKKPREEREKAVLIGLVEYYLETGKPVGSSTLRENGFHYISSATIRNYFAKLEAQGYLKQQHASGGRIPTPLAYKLFANTHRHACDISDVDHQELSKALSKEATTREVAHYLQHAAEILSSMTQCAAFLSSPRFDQDMIIEIKLLGIDSKRCLCVLITDFGLVHTEILYTQKKLSHFSIKRIESYFRFRISGLEHPKLTKEEEATATHFYNEILLRHIVGHSNFSVEDIYKTGFSKLLSYQEFREATALANGLALFEDSAYMRNLLMKCVEKGGLQVWIGDDLDHSHEGTSHCAIIAIPYFIHGKPVGAVALLGPTRLPYRKVFGIAKVFSRLVSDVLTRSLYRFKITYRQPNKKQIDLQSEHPKYLESVHRIQLEDQS